MKRVVLVLLVLVIIAWSGANVTVAISTYRNLPQVVVQNAIADAVEDLAKRKDIAYFLRVLSGGSVEFDVTVDSGKMGERFNEKPIKAAVGGKIYFGEDELYLENMYANASIPGADKSMDIRADVYLSDTYSYVSNESILGGAYGIVKGEMAQAFNDSEWAKKLDKTTREAVRSLLAFYDNEKTRDLHEDMGEIGDRYLALFVASFLKRAEYEIEYKDVEVAKRMEASRSITLSLDMKTVHAIFTDLYNELEKDEEFREFYIEYYNYMKGFSAKGSSSKDKSGEEDYRDLIKELKESLEKFERENKNNKTVYKMEVVTPVMTSTLRKLTLTVVKEEKSTDLLILDLGAKGAKKTDRIQITTRTGEGFIFEVEENNRAAYEASFKQITLVGQNNSENLFSVEEKLFVCVDKKNDMIELGLHNRTTKLCGYFEKSARRIALVLNRMVVDDVDTFTIEDGFELKLAFNQKDPIPAHLSSDEITNVLDLTVEDVEQIEERIEQIDYDVYISRAHNALRDTQVHSLYVKYQASCMELENVINELVYQYKQQYN